MIEYNELERILEDLTINELEQVKDILAEFSKESHEISKLDGYDLLKKIIEKEFISEYTYYYIKLGILKYGTYGLGEMINNIIEEKEIKEINTFFDFYNLQYDVIRWGRSKNINDPKSQFLKVVEEYGEIQRAEGTDELMDAIGDTLITLIILNDILQREIYGNQMITISDIKEEDLHKYINEKSGVSIAVDFKKAINTDVIVEFSKIAEYISKMTEDNKEYYIQKSYLHILEVVRYVFYLAEFEGVDFIKSLELAYNTVSKRTGKTVSGVFIKEEDL